MYVNLLHGRKAINPAAVADREGMALAAGAAGFRSSKKHKYAVRITLTMPDWDTQDVDSGVKALLDSVMGSRNDHRVVLLIVQKKVLGPGTPCHTVVKIREW